VGRETEGTRDGSVALVVMLSFGCHCFYRSMLNVQYISRCLSELLHVSHSTCSDCFVGLKFLYEKLHYKRHVSVWVTKLLFRFTVCLNKTGFVLLHRSTFFIQRFPSFSMEFFMLFRFFSLSTVLQYTLSNANQRICFHLIQ
jgi:hypothetical protein